VAVDRFGQVCRFLASFGQSGFPGDLEVLRERARAPGIAVICFVAWRADLLGAEGKRSHANNVSRHAHHASGMAGSPAR
jgi:hypothetical protein